MVEESVSQKIRFNNIDERRNKFVEEIEQNVMISKNHEKVCTPPNYV